MTFGRREGLSYIVLICYEEIGGIYRWGMY